MVNCTPKVEYNVWGVFVFIGIILLFVISSILDRGQTIVSDIKTSHKVYNEELQQVGLSDFSMEKDESNGKKKFFYISGPILDVLENGYTLVVDELDSKLHPNLVRKIVSLFNSKEYNKRMLN